MNTSSSCAICGAALSADGGCPQCTLRRESQFVHRELVVLLLLVGIAVAAFVATRAANRTPGPYLRLAVGLFVVMLGVSLIYGACRRLGWI